ncbi:hypothetical protein Tco_0690536 [Tanacetum coccineum]
MTSFNQRECNECGQPCDGFYCYLCTCQQCGVKLINGICLNCTYGDGKPVTCCGCEGPLNGRFCSFCASRAGNSFTYDPNPNSFYDSQNLSDYPPQPQYQTYSCEICGNDAHYGYDCPPQVPFYPVIHHPPQETSVEILQARENLMKSIQTFLIKFNRISFRETPKVLSLAWENFFEIQHAFREKQHQPEDIQELLRNLLKDLQIISEELAEYISPSWNCPAFYDDDDEYTIQYKEYLENSSNAITPDLPTEEPDNSLSMGDEHLSTIPEMESDEVIKSSVEDLVPIPSESEGISDDTCDVPFCDNSPPLDVLNDHFEIFSDFNDDCTSSDDDSFENIDYVEASLPDSELVSLEEVKDDILREKLLNINLLIAKIESLNDNPTPDCVFNSPFPFPIPVEDSDSFFEKSDTSLFYSDNSYPNSRLLAIIRKRRVVGKLTSVVMEDIMGEPRVHVPTVLPIHSTLMLDSDFIPSDDSLESDLEVSFPSGTSNKIFDPRIFFEVQSKRFLSRDTFSISFICNLLCPVIETLLPFSSDNEDKVFNLGIPISKDEKSPHLLSHQGFKVFPLINDSESPMIIYKGDIPILDVPYLHFYPLDQLKYGGSSQAQEPVNKNKHFAGGNPCLSLVVVS